MASYARPLVHHLVLIGLAVAALHLLIFTGVEALVRAEGGNLLKLVEGSALDEYAILAHSLLDDGRFVLSDGIPDTWRTPAMPIYLASFFVVFGDTLWPILVSFAALIGLLTALVAYAGEALGFSRRYATTVALLFSLSSGILLVSITGQGDTILYTCLYLAATCLILTFSTRPVTPRLAVAVGLLLGVATLLRPIGLLASLPVILALAIVPSREALPTLMSRVKLTLIALAVFVLCLLPWYYRNYVVSEHVVYSTLPAYNFVFYNIPYFLSFSEGTTEKEAREEVFARIPDAPIPELRNYPYAPEIEAVMREFIAEYWLPYSGFHLVKMIPFFAGSGFNVMNAILSSEAPSLRLPFFPTEEYNLSSFVLSGDWGRVFDVLSRFWLVTLERLMWLVFFALAFLSVFVSRGVERRVMLLLVLVILTNAFLTSPVTQPRYRIPAEPFIWIAAAYSAYALYHRWKKGPEAGKVIA